MSEKGNQAVKTVSFMMLITLFGKILGLVREQFLAANYATGMEAAAFLTASRIPRTFFDVVFASAISASFIPIFVEYLKKHGKEEAFALANRFITLISTATVVIMLGCMVFAEPLAWLFAPGYEVETIYLAVPLLKLLFPTMLFTAVAFSFVGILQSLDEFNVPAALSVVSNGILIFYYIFLNDRFGVWGLTIAFLIGWAMQAIIQIPSLRKKGYHYKPDFHFKDEGLKKIGKLMLPVMAEWDYTRLRTAPCRYAGTTFGDDLVILAHNYKRHFGQLSELKVGDAVTFTDMDGVVTNYEVVALDVLSATAVEEMVAGEYDLTLFTCTYGGKSRVTLRCDRAEG